LLVKIHNNFMIIQAIFTVFSFLLIKMMQMFPLDLPNTGMDDNIFASISIFGAWLYKANSFLPVSELMSIFLAVLTIEIAFFIWEASFFVYQRFFK